MERREGDQGFECRCLGTRHRNGLRIVLATGLCFARSSGHSREDAEDLTQSFFGRALALDWFQRADAEKGRFRTFLLTCFERHRAQLAKQASAAKRGGGVVPLDVDEVEESSLPSEAPKNVYDRQWALAVLATVLYQLQDEYAARGRAEQFEALRPHLSPTACRLSYAELARSLEVSLSSVKVAVHRLRKRYRQLLIAYIEETVPNPSDVDDEIRGLIASVS